MIDFTKLLNRTPEELELARLAIEERYEAMEARRVTDIQTRANKIGELVARIDIIPESNAKFIRDMAYKAETFGPSGQLGGCLGDLSERQIAYLDSLYAQYVISSFKDEESSSPSPSI